MHQIHIPVPAGVSHVQVLGKACREMKALGFFVWKTKVRVRPDGSVSAILPHVLFTDRPGNPGDSTSPGSPQERTKAFRALSKSMGLAGVYPHKVSGPH